MFCFPLKFTYRHKCDCEIVNIIKQTCSSKKKKTNQKDMQLLSEIPCLINSLSHLASLHISLLLSPSPPPPPVPHRALSGNAKTAEATRFNICNKNHLSIHTLSVWQQRCTCKMGFRDLMLLLTDQYVLQGQITVIAASRAKRFPSLGGFSIQVRH